MTRHEQRKAKGLCPYCCVPVADGRSACPECLRERAAKGRARWALVANTKPGRLRALMYQAHNTARERGLEFNLDLDHLVSIAPDACPVLGMTLDYGLKGARAAASPSLDRIDSGGGYVKGNVRVISWRANRLKSDATADELARVAAYAREAEAALRASWVEAA